MRQVDGVLFGAQVVDDLEGARRAGTQVIERRLRLPLVQRVVEVVCGAYGWCENEV